MKVEREGYSLELTEVKGIGDKKAEELKEHGITTAEELAVMHPQELADLLKISWGAAVSIIEDARAKTIEKIVEVRLLEDSEKFIKENVKYISTGSRNLDNLLGGGVRTDAITMVYGEFATLKTQLAYQLLVNCLASMPSSKVMFIETESGCFSPERIRQIQPTVPHNGELDIGKRVFHIPARTIANPFHQYLAYVRTQKLLESGEPIKLLIVDSFTAKFRGYYQKREQLGDRSRELARHMVLLDTLASKYNMAIFLTGQVMGVPTSEQEQVKVQGAPESVKFGLKGHKIWGGDLLVHSATYILALSRAKKDAWKAMLIDSPNLPNLETYFTVRAEGIRDYVGK